MKTMTSRQRLLAALKHEIPDRVPVAPDVSSMMPARYTGKPFWDVFVNDDPPLWRAHIALQKRFGYDMILGAGLGDGPDDPPSETRVLSRGEENWVAETVTHTKRGDLTVVSDYPRGRSPWVSKPLITDPEGQVDALLSTLTDPWKKDTAHAAEVRAAVGDNGICAAGCSVPLAWWLYARRDLSRSVLDFFDRQALVERAMAVYSEWALEYLRATCELIHPELLMFSGSVASMSVVSPDLYRRYAFPFLCQATAIAKKHGVFTGVHMCGRSRAALPMLVEAGIDLLEPLEQNPGGDIVLKDVKAQFGDRLCMKGNVNTFEVLARGTPEDVTASARQVIADAGEGGGLILSTGDQVSVDTPEENFKALIAAAQIYGVYA
jgi:uroporphyrinogen decarboxylase